MTEKMRLLLLVAIGEVGALLWRHASGIETLRPAGQWWGGNRRCGMAGIHIAVGIVGAGLWIDASWIFVSAAGRWCWCRVPAGLWLPLRLRLLPLGLWLPLGLGLWLPLGLRLWLPLGLRLLPLRLRIVQACIITEREIGAVLWIDTSRILGSGR